MKAACRFCHEVNEFDDPVPRRDPCRCGVSSDVLVVRSLVFAATVALVVWLAGCCVVSHYNAKVLERIPADRLESLPSPHPLECPVRVKK